MTYFQLDKTRINFPRCFYSCLLRGLWLLRCEKKQGYSFFTLTWDKDHAENLFDIAVRQAKEESQPSFKILKSVTIK